MLQLITKLKIAYFAGDLKSGFLIGKTFIQNLRIVYFPLEDVSIFFKGTILRRLKFISEISLKHLFCCLFYRKIFYIC